MATLVNLEALIRANGADAPIARGDVKVRYWAGGTVFTLVEGDKVIFPGPITVTIVDGELSEPLVLEPTRGLCCVRIQVESHAPENWKLPSRYVEIPDTTEIDFADLVDVDPATFAPTGPDVPAWSLVDQAVAARDAAIGARDAAQAAQATAGTSAFNAGASAAAAQSSEDDAEAAQVAAESARDTAAGHASAASGAASAATTSAGTATTQAGLAEGHAEDAAASALAAGDALAQIEIAGRFPVFSIDLTGGVDPADKETYISGSYAITLPDGTLAHSGGIRLRGRGNSTWGRAKKPWRVNFDTATAPLGMSASARNWALLANDLDPGKLNNAFALQLGARMSGLAWTPEERVVELVLNGTYRGLYQLADLVRMEAGRVAGPEPTAEGDGSDGAWLLEISNKERPVVGEWEESARNRATRPRGTDGSGAGIFGPQPARWFGAGTGTYTVMSEATDGPQGRGYLRKEWATASGYSDETGIEVARGGSGREFPVAAGVPVPLVGALRPSSAKTGQWWVQWRDVSNAVLSVSAQTPVTLPAGVWTWLTYSPTPPANAVKAVLILDIPAGSSWAAGATLDAVASIGAPAPYWDGDTEDTDTERHSWAGPAGASESIKETRELGATDPGFATTVYDQWIFYDTPEAPTAPQQSHILGVLDTFETALQTGDWATAATLGDYGSFADWWLIQELIKNVDSWNFYSSCKVHVTAGGVVTMGPMWDQDLSLSTEYPMPPTGWYIRTQTPWIDRLLLDPAFLTLARTRWTALLTELDAMGGLAWFDREAGRLTRAIRDDNVRWGQTTYVPLEVDRRKRWLAERIAWITTQLNP